MANFDTWRRRVRDHDVGVNCNYSKIFDLIEKQKAPIHWRSLATTQVTELPYDNWEWVATHIWTFIGGYVNDILLSRRSTMTNGEEFTGLELWKAIFQENCGGSAELANLERGYFVDFPTCDKPAGLQSHLGIGSRLRGKYGNELPAGHLIAMLHKILPDSIKDDVKRYVRQNNCELDLKKQIAYIHNEMGTILDEKLSRWNLTK